MIYYLYKIWMKIRQYIFLTLNPSVKIGVGTYGIPKVYSHKGRRLTLGKYCSISNNVVIFLGGEHRPDFVSMYPFNSFTLKYSHLEGHPKSKGDVVIGNDVWIGYGALITSGVKIGDGAVVGANSVVTKHVPPYTIVAGNPARVIRKRFNDDVIEKLLAIKWWNWPKNKIYDNVEVLFSEDTNGFVNSNFEIKNED